MTNNIKQNESITRDTRHYITCSLISLHVVAMTVFVVGLACYLTGTSFTEAFALLNVKPNLPPEMAVLGFVLGLGKYLPYLFLIGIAMFGFWFTDFLLIAKRKADLSTEISDNNVINLREE